MSEFVSNRTADLLEIANGLKIFDSLSALADFTQHPGDWFEIFALRSALQNSLPMSNRPGSPCGPDNFECRREPFEVNRQGYFRHPVPELTTQVGSIEGGLYAIGFDTRSRWRGKC